MSNCITCDIIIGVNGASCENKSHNFCIECIRLFVSVTPYANIHTCPEESCNHFLTLSSEGQKALFEVNQKKAIEIKEREQSLILQIGKEKAITAESLKSSRKLNIQHLYNKGTSTMIEVCPCCGIGFDDFDGCNALTCPECETAFCALCHKDCGKDAHSHIITEHGDNMLFNKPEYNRRKNERRLELIVGTLKEAVQPFSELFGPFVDIAEISPAELLGRSLPEAIRKELLKDIESGFDEERVKLLKIIRDNDIRVIASLQHQKRMLRQIDIQANEIVELKKQHAQYAAKDQCPINGAAEDLSEKYSEKTVEGWIKIRRRWERGHVCRNGPFCDELVSCPFYHQKLCLYHDDCIYKDKIHGCYNFHLKFIGEVCRL